LKFLFIVSQTEFILKNGNPVYLTMALQSYIEDGYRKEIAYAIFNEKENSNYLRFFGINTSAKLGNVIPDRNCSFSGCSWKERLKPFFFKELYDK
jgi:hypothetical protein